MLKPFPSTLGAICFGYAALHPYGQATSAVSDEACALTRNVNLVSIMGEQSHALFGRKANAISDLKTLATECIADNWDNQGASATNPVALQNAQDFIRALPDGLSMPEFAPEPDGAISLDWIQSRNRLLSLSIGSSNRIAYTWLDGTNKGHGVERFDRMSIPARILLEIQSIGKA